MSTSFYLGENYYPHCKRYEEITIGTRRGGNFTYSTDTTLDKNYWGTLLANTSDPIIDEYGNIYTYTEFLGKIK